MFSIYSLQMQLEEAEKDYKEALKNFEEIGPNKETLLRLTIANMTRKKLRDQLNSITPQA